MIWKILFFSQAIIPLLFEMVKMFSPCRYSRFTDRIKKKTKNKEDYEPIEYAYIIHAILYTLWGILGILSSQWVVFIILILLSIITGLIFKKKYYCSVIVVDSLLSILLIGYAVLNAFHFHINNIELIKNLF